MENQPSPVETFPILPGCGPARVTRSDDLLIRLQSYFAAGDAGHRAEPAVPGLSIRRAIDHSGEGISPR
jgi:hypothetical protein